MYVETEPLGTNGSFGAEIPSVTSEILLMIADLEYSDEKMKSLIDRLDISADGKSLVYAISKTTIRAGRVIVRIGRKIVDCVLRVFNEFPGAGFGLILGGILGVLVASIPVIGAALSQFAVPLLAMFGMVVGLKQDIRDRALINRVATINKKFEAFGEQN
jgi:hypothetical protein